MPVSKPPWIILHGRLHPRLDHLKGVRLIHNTAQKARWKTTGAEFGLGNHAAQIIEIRLDAIKSRLCQGSSQPHDSGVAIVRMDNDFGEHWIVEGSDLR